MRLPALIGTLALVLAALAGCAPSVSGAAGATDQGPAAEVRLGYFPNVTHAPALVAVRSGLLADALGSTNLTTQVFAAGPAAIEALNAGAVDATFIGPNPAVNGYLQSEGQSLRIVGGSTSGGAQLVVRPDIESPAELEGTTLASPQLGGTQDVALRSWLADHGLQTTLRGDGDVAITPTDGASALQLFRDGTLDGAWLPEPWASRLVLEAGGHVLVDERDLWPQGRFPTTHLIVSARFLAEHPATVEALLTGTLAAIEWIGAHPGEAGSVVNEALEDHTAARLRGDVLERAMSGVTFTHDPVAEALDDLLADAERAGTAPRGSLEGIYDLRLLNDVLAERGAASVSAAGLGLE